MAMNWPMTGYPGYGGFGTPQQTYPNVAQPTMPRGVPAYSGVGARGVTTQDASVSGSTAPTTPYTPPGTASTAGVPGAGTGLTQNLTEWLTSPQQAMIAAFARNGISPFSTDFKVKQALKRADEIMSNILVNAAQAGTGAGDIGNFVSGQIMGALNGSPIFRSGSNLTSMLQGLQSMARSSEQAGMDIGTSNPALAVLGTALGDPTASANLLTNLMTGGMSTQLANIAGARYAALPGLFNVFQESPTGQQAHGSLIDLLLSGAFQPNATALQQLYAGSTAGGQ